MVRTGTATTPIYERTIYIDGVFEYVILEDTSGTYEKNYIHIMDDKSRIAEVRVGTPFPNDITDDITYTLENNIGSSVVRLDINGTVIDREEYYPFGDSSLRTFTYKRYRYVGKERDQESGLYYYGARYYAAWTCRFISVDPLAAKYVWQSSYAHAANNPITKIDFNGLGPDDPPKGSANNPVVLQEVEVTATRTYPSAVSTGATSLPRADNITPGKSVLQETFREKATQYAIYKNMESGGESAKNASDENITTSQLGYQWVMGTGKNSHTFTENSVMGKQMLATPEITNAVQNTITKAVYQGETNATTAFARSLSKENPLLYVESFFIDLQDNPARAYHGSFAGQVTLDNISPVDESGNVTLQMTVTLKDNMSAPSGTRYPPFLGGYKPGEPSAIYPTENPYGPNGQFRSVMMEYNMKISVTMSAYPQTGDMKSASSQLVTPTIVKPK